MIFVLQKDHHKLSFKWIPFNIYTYFQFSTFLLHKIFRSLRKTGVNYLCLFEKHIVTMLTTRCAICINGMYLVQGKRNTSIKFNVSQLSAKTKQKKNKSIFPFEVNKNFKVLHNFKL